MRICYSLNYCIRPLYCYNLNMNEDFTPADAANFKFPDLPKPPEISGNIPVYQTPETKEAKEERITDQLERWQNVETLTNEEMVKMFRDDGMALVHGSGDTALRNGFLTATGIRKDRGEELSAVQNEIGHQKVVWFNLNKVFEGRSVLFLFHPGAIYSRFVHNQSIEKTGDYGAYIGVSGTGPSESTSYDVPLDYGIVLLPKTEQERYKKFFEENGYRPSHIFYYEGENGAKGLDDWRQKNMIPSPNSNRLKEVYHHKYWDISFHQDGQSVDSPDGGFKITQPVIDGYVAQEQV